MADKRYCEAKLTGDLKHLVCSRVAVAFVSYFNDGSGGKYACLHHLQRVIEDVSCGSSVPYGATLRFTPLGQLADKIGQRKNRARRAAERGA